MTLDSILDALADRIAERLQGTGGRKLLTLSQAAGQLGRSRASVQQLVARREIPAVRHGRRVHILATDIDQWIDKNRVQ